MSTINEWKLILYEWFSSCIGCFLCDFFYFCCLVFSGSPSSNQMDFVQIPLNIKKNRLFSGSFSVFFFFATRFQCDLDMTEIISVKKIYDITFPKIWFKRNGKKEGAKKTCLTYKCIAHTFNGVHSPQFSFIFIKFCVFFTMNLTNTHPNQLAVKLASFECPHFFFVPSAHTVSKT